MWVPMPPQGRNARSALAQRVPQLLPNFRDRWTGLDEQGAVLAELLAQNNVLLQELVAQRQGVAPTTIEVPGGTEREMVTTERTEVVEKETTIVSSLQELVKILDNGWQQAQLNVTDARGQRIVFDYLDLQILRRLDFSLALDILSRKGLINRVFFQFVDNPAISGLAGATGIYRVPAGKVAFLRRAYFSAEVEWNWSLHVAFDRDATDDPALADFAIRFIDDFGGHRALDFSDIFFLNTALTTAGLINAGKSIKNPFDSRISIYLDNTGAAPGATNRIRWHFEIFEMTPDDWNALQKIFIYRPAETLAKLAKIFDTPRSW